MATTVISVKQRNRLLGGFVVFYIVCPLFRVKLRRCIALHRRYTIETHTGVWNA